MQSQKPSEKGATHMRRLRLLQLQLLPITGLALLLAALAAAAQDDSGTLEVLVEDTSGPRFAGRHPGPDLSGDRSGTGAVVHRSGGADRHRGRAPHHADGHQAGVADRGQRLSRDFLRPDQRWPGLGALWEGPVRLYRGLLLAAGHSCPRVGCTGHGPGRPRGYLGRGSPCGVAHPGGFADGV